MNDDLRTAAERLIANWYEEYRGKSQVGIPNTGLVVLEIFRTIYPLEASDVITPGGGQVRLLGGRRANEIIRRFLPDARELGTESGRTSRGTSEAARALAVRLNDIQGAELTDEDVRSDLADAMQRWIVNNPISDYYARQRLKPELGLNLGSIRNVSRTLDGARERGQAGPLAQHLVGAKLQLRFPELEIPNHSYSTADVQTGRGGDFVVGDAVFHVTVSPMQILMEKCAANLLDGFRVVVVVPESARAAAQQLLEVQGIGDRVDVFSLEAFVAQNVDEMAEFATANYRIKLRELFEAYNARVEAVEPDQSLQIEIPENL